MLKLGGRKYLVYNQLTIQPTNHPTIPYVVDPAVYGHRHQQLQVEPQSEEGVSFLVTDVMNHAGFVQLRLQLVAQIPGYCKEQRE